MFLIRIFLQYFAKFSIKMLNLNELSRFHYANVSFKFKVLSCTPNPRVFIFLFPSHELRHFP